MTGVPLPVPAARLQTPVRGAGLRPALLLAAVTAVVAVVPLLSAAPAWAHDRLERIDPAPAQQLDRDPGQVQLVFDQAVGRRFSTVVVTGPDGADWAAGPAQVLDGTVTQPLKPSGPAGAYTVAYRIVSADGHPVTGTSTFTVAGAVPAAGPSAAGQGGAGTSPAPPSPLSPVSAAPGPAAGAAASTAPPTAGHQHDLTGPAVVGPLAVVLLGAASVFAVRRRRVAGAAHRTQGGRS